jgi:hypothetical protein
MHTFSFSLYGADPRYTSGIERNQQFLKNSGIDYQVILHTDQATAIPHNWSIVLHKVKHPLDCHFWRFLSVGQHERVHVRDIDSTISDRELPELSRADIYCMRDHYWHAPVGGAPSPVQGGMWGATGGILPFNFPKLVQWWIDNKSPFERYSDMWFLNRYVYPYIRRFGLEIDGVGSAWGGVPFLTSRVGNSYVGSY